MGMTITITRNSILRSSRLISIVMSVWCLLASRRVARGWTTVAHHKMRHHHRRLSTMTPSQVLLQPPPYQQSRLFSTATDAAQSASPLTNDSEQVHDNDNDDNSNQDATTPDRPPKFVPYPFEYKQQVDITIDSLTNRGMGIGRIEIDALMDRSAVKALFQTKTSGKKRWRRGRKQRTTTVVSSLEAAGIVDVLDDAPDPTNHDNNDVDATEKRKWVIMVFGVIPGERVRVSVFRNHPNYSEADLVTVLEASPDRVVPPCPVAADCGGCQWQHMTIERQRDWKTRLVRQALAQYHVPGVQVDEEPQQQQHNDMVQVQPCLGTEQTLGYRSKLTPHFQQPRSSRRGTDNDESPTTVTIPAIGFQKQTLRQIIDVPSCLIATPAVNAAYQAKRDELRARPVEDWNPKNQNAHLKKRKNRPTGATLLFRQGDLSDDRDDVLVETDHQAYVTTTVRGLQFRYRAGNFFQNNYYVLPHMVDQVLEQATRATSGQRRMTHLADCYCGSGLFALSAAAHLDRVVGIEVNPQAIQEATANAIANGIENVEFLAASAEAIFGVIDGSNDNTTTTASFPVDTTAVVVDPPRKGCSDEFLEQLYAFGPQRVVYMSCDVTTQARDAASLVDRGGYRLTYVQPFDLFPQTRHIECLMVFEKQR